MFLSWEDIGCDFQRFSENDYARYGRLELAPNRLRFVKTAIDCNKVPKIARATDHTDKKAVRSALVKTQNALECFP